MPDDVPDDTMAAADEAKRKADLRKDEAKHHADLRKDEAKHDADLRKAEIEHDAAAKDDVNEQRVERAEEKFTEVRRAGRKHDRAD